MTVAVVTGAAGFLGSAVVRHLLAAGWRVRGVRRASSSLELVAGLPVEWAEADVTDTESLRGAFDGADVVFHVAGRVNVFARQDPMMVRVNVFGSRNVFAEALRARVGRLVHTSSVAAIGYPRPGTLGSERTPYNWTPYHLAYMETKHRAELELARFVEQGLDAVVVNPSTIVGPGDRSRHGSGFLIDLARRRIPGNPAGGQCVADVDDVAAGHILAAERGKTGERYILGGENLTYRTILATAAEELGVPAPAWAIPPWVVHTAGWLALGWSRLSGRRLLFDPQVAALAQMEMYYSSRRAEEELGYAITPFRLSVRRAIAWYREHGYIDSEQ